MVYTRFHAPSCARLCVCEQVTQEDIEVCEAVQERLASGGYLGPGPLSPRHEQGVAYFQRRVRTLHNLHATAPEDQY